MRFFSRPASFLAILALVFLNLAYGPLAQAAGNSTLSFSPSTRSIATGASTTLDAVVNPGPTPHHVSSVSARITYNQTKLNLTGITCSSTFGTELFKNIPSTPDGTARIDCAIPGANPSVTTTTTVATFSFTALATVSNSPVAFTAQSSIGADDALGVNVFDGDIVTGAAAVTVTSGGGDSTPPVLSNGAPFGTLASGTTDTNMTVTTDEGATCKYSTTTGTAYASMTHTFTMTGGTLHSVSISSLTDGNDYHYYIRCQDTSNNPDVSDYAISFSVASSSFGGGTPPSIFSSLPSGTLPAGTTNTDLSVMTDVDATCKFGTIPNVAFDSIANTFTTTGGTTHSFALIGLVNGTDYNYYIRCSAASDGTVNSSDYALTFGIASSSSSSSSSSSKSSGSSHHKKKKTSSRTISNSPSTIQRGQILIQSGKHFSKSSAVALYFSRPGGAYYPPQIVRTTSTGSFSVTYRVIKPAGKYSWYAVNLATGWKSKLKTYTVK